jgi:hypothetical protein
MARCQVVVTPTLYSCVSAGEYSQPGTVSYPAPISDAEWERRVTGLATRLGVSFTEANREFFARRWPGVSYETRSRSIATLRRASRRMQFCS